jgi:hypothetical protein
MEVKIARRCPFLANDEGNGLFGNSRASVMFRTAWSDFLA